MVRGLAASFGRWPGIGFALVLAGSVPSFFHRTAPAVRFSLSWACAKEVNPPLLSGMATSIVNVGCFLGAGILQPAVGWMLDRQWDGSLQAGTPHYGQAGFSSGMMLFLGAAWAGFIATLFVRETGCRNLIDSPP